MSRDKLDLVYILGSGSDWSDNEIRYSLRSAEQYFTYDRVFIIGECPSWLQNVIHIPFPDRHQHKTSNGIAKALRAAKEKSISERFILMNDDHFFLKKQTAVPYYYKGTAREFIERHPTQAGSYFHALRNTENFLERQGVKNPKDYAVHSPIIYEKTKLRELKKFRELKNYLLRSVYCNLYKVKSVKGQDFKANSLTQFHQILERNTPILSGSDDIVKERAFLDWISQKFPTPSKYEADNWHLNLI